MAGVVAALSWASPPGALRASAEREAPAKERLAPDGIDGSLVLCGDRPSDAALDGFFDQAGKDKARIVVLVAGRIGDEGAADDVAKAIKDRKAAFVDIYEWNPENLTWPGVPRKASGVCLLRVGGKGPMDLSRPSDAAMLG